MNQLDQALAREAELIARLEQVEAQRDELRAVIKDAVGGLPYLVEVAGVNKPEWAAWIQRAKEAIAKGGAT